MPDSSQARPPVVGYVDWNPTRFEPPTSLRPIQNPGTIGPEGNVLPPPILSSQTGWICPRCGAVWGPQMYGCPCSPSVTARLEGADADGDPVTDVGPYDHPEAGAQPLQSSATTRVHPYDALIIRFNNLLYDLEERKGELVTSGEWPHLLDEVLAELRRLRGDYDQERQR